MVGGKGTRVKKITKGSSKAEIILNKKNKLIDFQLESLIKLQKKIFILSNKKFKNLKHYVNRKYHNSNISILEDAKQKGTAGALKNLPENNIKDDYLIVFGDLLFNINFSSYSNFISKKSKFT